MEPSASLRALLGFSLIGLVALAGCGGRVGFVNQERPGLSGTGPVAHTPAAPTNSDEDEPEGAEPDHPLVSTKQERAMVHVHSGSVACAGVVLGPRLVATSRRCLQHAQGAQALVKKEDSVRVELASGSLAWAQRAASHVLVPGCPRRDFDVALVVLAEAADWVQPLELASAPGPDAKVDALGFERCDGSKEVKRALVVSREDTRITIDRVPCPGDIGGPVVETSSGRLIGIESHRRGGPESRRKETAVTRFDTTPMRELLAQAKAVIEGADPASLKPVACAAR